MDFSELCTSEGILERPLQAAGWLVPPRILLEREALLWSVGPKGYHECRRETPSAGLLEQFVRLVDAPADRILTFSRRFGMLGVKKPRDKPKPEEWRVLNKRYGSDYGYSVLETPSYGRGMCGGEPVKNWRFWAEKFSAALEIGVSLSHDKYGDARTWHTIFEGEYLPPIKGSYVLPEGVTDRDVFKETRGEFYTQIESWLTLGDVSLRLDYEGKGLMFATDTLFSGLVLQLASSLCGSGGFAICACCAKPYAPVRQPTPATRHYCKECGRRAAVRDAVRDFRARRRLTFSRPENHRAFDDRADTDAEMD